MYTRGTSKLQQKAHPAKFFTGASVVDAFMEELSAMGSSFCGFLYQVDHTSLIVQMVVKLTKGIQGRLILDRANFFSSSCARQADRIKDIFNAGCQIRLMQPEGGVHACMHVKAMIFDEKTLLEGSANLTHNGLENNKEHLYRQTEPPLVALVLADFEKEWAAAANSQVTIEDVEKAIENRRQSLKAAQDRAGAVANRPTSLRMSARKIEGPQSRSKSQPREPR